MRVSTEHVSGVFQLGMRLWCYGLVQAIREVLFEGQQPDERMFAEGNAHSPFRRNGKQQSREKMKGALLQDCPSPVPPCVVLLQDVLGKAGAMGATGSRACACEESNTLSSPRLGPWGRCV